MKNPQVKFLTLSLILLLSAILIVNFGCGGSDSTGAIPGNLSQGTTVQLVSREVSGYIFATNGLSSSRAGEEVSQRFVVLDVPLTGEDAFLNQVSSALQEDYPEDWNNPKMQELFNKLSAELSGWQSLSAINGAQLFTVYQDSRSENPLTVGEDGYFEGSVMVASTDDLVKFEVVIGEEDCYAVETIASSDMTASEGDSPSLSSCPEIILNFPGFCSLFRVHGNGINLKEAGLTFTLNASSIGCVTAPIYLRCRGSRKYNVGYGIFYANPGLTTPIDTTITASTTTGLTLSIFTEVIGSSASIRGHVGGAGVVPVFGFVYSFGCHAFDCLNEAGDYHLSSVFQGHNRKVVAIYWLVQPDGRWKKYREERTVGFFGGDLSGFDLPETVVDRLPTDPYYDRISLKIAKQKWEWRGDLGEELAAQKTVDWINGLVPEKPLPAEIAEAIATAELDEYERGRIWLKFKDGMSVTIAGQGHWEEDISSMDTKIYNNLSSPPVSAGEADTVGTCNILMIHPFAWE